MTPNSIHIPSIIALLLSCGRHLLQVHQGYSDLVKGLLEKLTLDHSTSVGIAASAFTLHFPPAEGGHNGRTDGGTSGRTPAHASHLKSHADLRYAVALLLLAAEALPEPDVEFSVCRLLFDQASQPLNKNNSKINIIHGNNTSMPADARYPPGVS